MVGGPHGTRQDSVEGKNWKDGAERIIDAGISIGTGEVGWQKRTRSVRGVKGNSSLSLMIQPLPVVHQVIGG